MQNPCSENGFICFVTGLNVMNPDRSWNGLYYVMLIYDTGLFNCKIKENTILNQALQLYFTLRIITCCQQMPCWKLLKKFPIIGEKGTPIGTDLEYQPPSEAWYLASLGACAMLWTRHAGRRACFVLNGIRVASPQMWNQWTCFF